MTRRRALLQDFGIVVLLLALAAALLVAPLVASPPRSLLEWAAVESPRIERFVDESLPLLARPNRLPLLLLFGAGMIVFLGSLRRTAPAWLTRGIPPTSPLALALFRTAFGMGLAAAVAATDPNAVPVELQRPASWLADIAPIRGIAASDTAIEALTSTLVLALLAFALGLFPRLMLALSAVLMTAFSCVLLTRASAHDWGVPTVTVWMLTAAPWHEAPGIRTLGARGVALPTDGATARGVALWIPGLTVGLALLAAAFAKLDASGFAWITGGAVRYHFVEDGRGAPVDWGLRLATSDAAAVALSLGAIVTEATVWLVIWLRGPRLRLLFGVAAAALLAGFYLFQGVAWPAWWVLLLAFVPWERIAASVGGGYRVHVAPPVTPRLSRFAVALVGVFVLQQIAASALRVESEPLVSHFPMYSHTWPSRAAFDAALADESSAYSASTDAHDDAVIQSRFAHIPRAADALTEAIERADAGWPADTRAAIDRLRQEYARLFGEDLRVVTVTRHEERFDWQRGRYVEVRDIPVGRLDLVAGVLIRPPADSRNGRR